MIEPGVVEIRSFLDTLQAQRNAGWAARLAHEAGRDVDIHAALERDDAIGVRVALSAVAYRLFHPDYPQRLRLAFGILQVKLP